MSVFNFIKIHISIVDVVNEYTTLKKTGNYLKSRCPFHHEKTASFTVSPHKEIYYCFGCHTGGDVISFIAKIENISQIEAAKFLADRYSIKIPDESFATNNQEKKKQYYDICKSFAIWAHKQLLKNPSALKYIQDRSIDIDLVSRFTVGFFPSGLATIKECIVSFNKENILVDDLLNAHILAQGKTVLYSPFEDRILFPIKDHLGRFCGFGGRIYKPLDQRPKYYNSRENEFFIKGNILFGLDAAKKSIQEQSIAFLVEGYTDCIAMVQHGYPNSVATLGTACTINHLKLLSRYANYLYLLYDSDKAGQDAMLRLAQICWQANMELKVVHLPIGQDPASFLAAGNDLNQRIAQAEDIFAFFIATLGKEFNIQPLAEKMDRVRTFLEIIHAITDSLKQDLLLQIAARTFDIPFETLKRELGPVSIPQKTPQENPDNTNSLMEEENEPSTLEKRLFCAILNSIDLLKSIKDHYLLKTMHPQLKKILEQIVAITQQESSLDFSQIFDTLKQEDKQYISGLLLEYDEPINRNTYTQLCEQFQKQQWKQITRTIKNQLQHAQNKGDQEMIQSILNDYAVLKQKIFVPIR